MYLLIATNLKQISSYHFVNYNESVFTVSEYLLHIEIRHLNGNNTSSDSAVKQNGHILSLDQSN